MSFDELLSQQKPRKNSRGRRAIETREPREPAAARGSNSRKRTKEVPAPKERTAAVRSNRKRAAPAVIRGEPSVPLVLDAPDPWLLATMYALVGFGLVMVYSASAVWADRNMHDAHALIRLQLYHALLAGVAAWIVGHYGDYRWLRRFTYPMLLATALMLLLTTGQYGETAGGAKRWLKVFGLLRVQPAELAKLVLILWLADSLAKKREQIRTFSVGFFPHVLGAVLLAGLCYAQPDFGSTAMIILLLFAMLFTAGARLGFIVASAFVGVVTLAIAAASSPYRLRRIAAFWPRAYQWLLDNVDWLAKKAVDMKAPDNYQVWESQLSFGAGGVWGVGLGNSHQKLLYLPEAHTDFISSIVAEELGLVGVAAMLLAFGVLVYRGIRTGLSSPDIYGTYLCVGISVFIGMQAFTNLAVAVGVVPTKGLVLPFVSYGGTSLVVNCIAVGLMSNASRLQRADAVAVAPPARTETAARAVGGVS